MRRTAAALACALLLTACTSDADGPGPAPSQNTSSSARIAAQGDDSTGVCLTVPEAAHQYAVSSPPVRALGGDVTLTGVELHESEGVELVEMLVATPGPGASDGLWTSDWPADAGEDGGQVLDWSSRRPLAQAELPSGTALVPVTALEVRAPAHFGGLSISFQRPDGTTGSDVVQSDVSFAAGTGCDDQPAP